MYTLAQRVDFDSQYRFLFTPEDGKKKPSFEDEVHFFRVCTYAYSHLHNLPFEEVARMDIKEVVAECSPFITPLPQPVPWHHNVELVHNSPISLNQFITSKENARIITGIQGMTIYEALPIIIATYKQDGFSDDFEANLLPDSELMIEVRDMPLNQAVFIMNWYFKHNNHIQESFSLFKPNRSKGIDMEEHFNAYGWLSFLSMIAKEGVFNVSGNGLNAIENAKRAKLYDVLLYASEKKDSEDAINFYQEREMQKVK